MCRLLAKRQSDARPRQRCHALTYSIRVVNGRRHSSTGDLRKRAAGRSLCPAALTATSHWSGSSRLETIVECAIVRNRAPPHVAGRFTRPSRQWISSATSSHRLHRTEPRCGRDLTIESDPFRSHSYSTAFPRSLRQSWRTAFPKVTILPFAPVIRPEAAHPAAPLQASVAVAASPVILNLLHVFL
jgi:hypothetical protein